MFLFPKREEELWSETTELKHRKASWALTQSAVGLFSLRLLSPYLHSFSTLKFIH